MTSHRLQRVGPCRNECSANANAIGLSSNNRLLCCWVNCMHACMRVAGGVGCLPFTVPVLYVRDSSSSCGCAINGPPCMFTAVTCPLWTPLLVRCCAWTLESGARFGSRFSFVAAVRGACDPSIDLTAVTTGSRSRRQCSAVRCVQTAKLHASLFATSVGWRRPAGRYVQLFSPQPLPA